MISIINTVIAPIDPPITAPHAINTIMHVKDEGYVYTQVG